MTKEELQQKRQYLLNELSQLNVSARQGYVGQQLRNQIDNVDQQLSQIPAPASEPTQTPLTPTEIQAATQQFISDNIAPLAIPQAVQTYASGTPTDYGTADISSLTPFTTRDNRSIVDKTGDIQGIADKFGLDMNTLAGKYNLLDTAQGKYVNPETNPMFEILFDKALEESMPALRTSMQTSGRSGSGTQSLLEGKLLSDLAANIYAPERAYQTQAQQYLTGLDVNTIQDLINKEVSKGTYLTGLQENATQNEIQNALNAATNITNIKEGGRRFNAQATDNDRIRRLNLLSQIAGTETNYNQSVLDLPYNYAKRIKELETPSGNVGGTTTSQVYTPNWLQSAFGDISAGIGLYNTGTQAGLWNRGTSTTLMPTSPLGTDSYDDIYKNSKKSYSPMIGGY